MLNSCQRYKSRPRNLFAPHPASLDYFIAIAGLPLGLIGLIVHIPPVSSARHITARRVKEPDFVAPIFLCLSVVFMILWYALLSSWFLVGRHYGSLWIPALLLPVSGIFCLKAWFPALRRATGPLVRRWYRRTNPSAGLVFTLTNALLNFANAAIRWEPAGEEHI